MTGLRRLKFKEGPLSVPLDTCRILAVNTVSTFRKRCQMLMMTMTRERSFYPQKSCIEKGKEEQGEGGTDG